MLVMRRLPGRLRREVHHPREPHPIESCLCTSTMRATAAVGHHWADGRTDLGGPAIDFVDRNVDGTRQMAAGKLGRRAYVHQRGTTGHRSCAIAEVLLLSLNSPNMAAPLFRSGACAIKVGPRNPTTAMVMTTTANPRRSTRWGTRLANSDPSRLPMAQLRSGARTKPGSALNNMLMAPNQAQARRA